MTFTPTAAGQAYFRINAENMGQFERTLIIVLLPESQPVCASVALFALAAFVIIEARAFVERMWALAGPARCL